jgi:hypothetical protein
MSLLLVEHLAAVMYFGGYQRAASNKQQQEM